MSENMALYTLAGIENKIRFHQPVTDFDQNTVIQALDHSNLDVIRAGLDLLKTTVEDITPYTDRLIELADNHELNLLSQAAFEAISKADDLTPFYPSIMRAVQSGKLNIILNALKVIEYKIDRSNVLYTAAPEEIEILKYVLDDQTACYFGTDPQILALFIIQDIEDKTPFIDQLNSFLVDRLYSQNLRERAISNMIAADDISPFREALESYSAHFTIASTHIKKELGALGIAVKKNPLEYSNPTTPEQS